MNTDERGFKKLGRKRTRVRREFFQEKRMGDAKVGGAARARTSAICNPQLLFGGEVKTMFKGRRVIVIGERDGVPGPAISNCVTAAGGQVVYTTTECFV